MKNKMTFEDKSMTKSFIKQLVDKGHSEEEARIMVEKMMQKTKGGK